MPTSIALTSRWLPGCEVKDASGAEVEYSSGTVKMKQMTLTVTYRDDLKWQDGSAVAKADFELGQKIDLR